MTLFFIANMSPYIKNSFKKIEKCIRLIWKSKSVKLKQMRRNKHNFNKKSLTTQKHCSDSSTGLVRTGIEDLSSYLAPMHRTSGMLTLLGTKIFNVYLIQL